MSDPALMSSAKLTAELQQIRTEIKRDPLLVLHYGEVLLARGTLKSGDDEVWSVTEQVAVAALECGRMEQAQGYVDQLTKRFPGSPRVAVLVGMLIEAKGLTEEAREYYEGILKEDETDLAVTKRLIALHLAVPPSSSSSALVAASSKSKAKATVSSLSFETGISLLVDYLDAFYTDPDGWSQLAAAYASIGLYAQSLSALSHLVLLLPHNPYHLLHHAETAYTMGDYSLAYLEFLRVIEMSDGVPAVGGAGRRAAMGVKLCVKRLAAQTKVEENEMLRPQALNDVDLMVTKLVLKAYLKPEAVGAGLVRKWIGGQ